MRAETPAREPAPAVEAVERVLRAAAARGASDVHLDPCPDGVRVRFRVDGVLETSETLPAALRDALVGRLKALSALLAYRTDLPQEGRIPAARSPIGAEVRVATFPALHGERVALRLSAGASGAPTLDALGLPDVVRESLTAALAQRDGAVLVTGPAGSGKTTTLYACMRHVAEGDEGRSVVSIEDPVERAVPGIVQTEVDAAAGLDFARALRSLLRQDPDVLLVGEIRDRETAAIALEAGLTGHLVASSVHAGTAPAVFARLLEMEVEPFVLTTAVRGVLAQRLLRRTCGACGGAGCDACGATGYRGRVVAAQWTPVGVRLRDAILARGDGTRLATAAEEDGGASLLAGARELVRAGHTTQSEVLRVLGRI